MNNKEKKWITILIGWITLHFLFLVLGGGYEIGGKYTFPFHPKYFGSLKLYDYSDFLIYTFPPIVMFLVYWYVWRDKE